MTRDALGGLLVLTLALGVAACGDDDGDTAGGEAAGFCDAGVEVNTTFNAEFAAVDFESSSPEELERTFADIAARVDPLMARVEQTAPDDLRDEVETAVEGTRLSFETGEEPDDPAYAAAIRAIDEFLIAECGLQSHDVAAVDYEFEGVPDEVDAGVVVFDVANQGSESHEMQVFRVDDEVDDSVEDLLAEGSSALAKVTPVGGAFAEPGDHAATFFDLQPGRYGAACFIPVGATPGAEDPAGPPHFTEGMLAEFTVS
jgi:hypothetical protein